MMKSGSRSITVIGPGVRVEGTVTFNGYLRVQGDVLGDVTCTSDSDGTVVVHKSGNLTGALKAPHVVVSGHVVGPVNSSSTIEVNDGASVIGDAVYRQIDVHAGGVVNGLLTPTAATGVATDEANQPRQTLPPPASSRVDEAGTGKSHKGWMAGGIAALVVAAVGATTMWTGRSQPTIVAAPTSEVVTMTESPILSKEPQPAAPPRPAAVVTPLPVETKAPLPVLVSPVAPAKVVQPAAAVPVAATVDAIPPSDKIVTVEGLNPDKPADAFFVSSRQPSVIYKRKRDEAGAGSRIDIHRGAKIRIVISGDEVFRVAEGPNIDVFYQGRKVTPRIVASGAWLSFVPIGPSEAAGPQ
jgi:cytoskeletal protein CcmA (bactofilin family)